MRDSAAQIRADRASGRAFVFELALAARTGAAHSHSVGVIDETSFAKKGAKTVCVQRQPCDCLGTLENCVVSVHNGPELTVCQARTAPQEGTGPATRL